QPRAYVRPLLELPQLPVRLDPRLLDGVLRIGGAAREALGHREEVSAVALDEASERVGITCTRPGHGRPVGFVHPWNFDGVAGNWLARAFVPGKRRGAGGGSRPSPAGC